MSALAAQAVYARAALRRRMQATFSKLPPPALDEDGNLQPKVSMDDIPAAAQPLVAPIDVRGTGEIAVSDFRAAAELYEAAQHSRLPVWWVFQLLRVLVVGALVMGCCWAVVTSLKDARTTAAGALLSTQSGRLVTVNARVSRAVRPVTGFLPRARLLDLTHVVLSPAAADAGGAEVALRVDGFMLAVDARGTPALSVVTSAGDVVFSGTAASADWGRVASALGVAPFGAPPLVSGTFGRANPFAAGGTVEAYQAAVARCDFRLVGAAAVAPAGGAGGGEHARACDAKAAFERSRVADLAAGRG